MKEQALKKGQTTATASQKTSTTIKFKTREQWLHALARKMNKPLFNGQLPKKLRITCGWSSKGGRSSVIGECYPEILSADGTREVIVGMMLDEPMRVADVLAHELCHAILPAGTGHGPEFRKLALSIGLTGKMTATVAGPEFIEKVQPMLDALGPYPHAELMTSVSFKRSGKGGKDGKIVITPRKPEGAPKKQGTRMIKCTCSTCGYIARTSSKWIDEVGALRTAPFMAKWKSPNGHQTSNGSGSRRLWRESRIKRSDPHP